MESLPSRTIAQSRPGINSNYIRKSAFLNAFYNPDLSCGGLELSLKFE